MAAAETTDFQEVPLGGDDAAASVISSTVVPAEKAASDSGSAAASPVLTIDGAIKASPMKITITDMEERKSTLSKYTVFIIEVEPAFPSVLRVARRYNHFKWLREQLNKQFPGMFMPPLPPAKAMGRFDEHFLAERKHDLQRFLNRVASVDCFRANIAFQVFLTRPELSFEEGQRMALDSIEFGINGTFERLCRIYPALVSVHLAPTILREDIAQLKEFLERVSTQMATLGDSTTRLMDTMCDSALEMEKFSYAFKDLYETETSYPYAPATARTDVRKEIDGWKQWHFSLTDTYYSHFHRPLRYENEDIRAMIEIFTNLAKQTTALDKAQARVEKWELRIAHGRKPLTADDEKAKASDEKARDELKRLVQMVCKVILNLEIDRVWVQKNETWRAEIIAFAKECADISTTMSEMWSALVV